MSDLISKKKLKEMFEEDGHLSAYIEEMIDSVPTSDIEAELRHCRNELCLYCGNYKQKHNGACDDCRWRNRG